MRALRVGVCVKPVPDAEAANGLDSGTGVPDRAGRMVLDDADAVGVEVALQVVESAGGGSVILLAMTPESGHPAVRSALAMGAHEAIVVTDDALAGSDALATAKVLAALGRRLELDLLLAGTESTDAASGVAPGQVAELLGWPAVTLARKVDVDRGASEVRAERVTATGWEVVASRLPCLLTVAASAAAPRYPSMKGIMGARAKPFDVLDVVGLGLASGDLGWAGARQEVLAVDAVENRRATEMVDDTDASAHERILALLARTGVL